MKTRITITLSNDVFLKLDKLITNRSQYIEWLIRQDLKIEFKPMKNEVKK